MTAPIDDVFSIGDTRRVPTPPAPTLAPGRERVTVDRAALEAMVAARFGTPEFHEAATLVTATARPLPVAPVAAMTEAEARALVDAYARASDMAFIGHVSDPNDDGPSEALDAAYRALIAALTATPAVPVAGAFVEAVDALDKAAYAVAAWDAGGPSALGDPTHHRHAARAALLDAHAAAVADAYATGYARAMAEVDAACSALAGDDEHESIALWRLAPYGWRAEVATAESGAVGVGQTATAAIIDLLDCDRAAADMAAHMDADPPALVNGGPPTDALDDGR